MEKKKEKIKCPAVRMKKKQARKLANLKHCCIPATVVKLVEVKDEETGEVIQVVNPDIKSNGNGTFGKEGAYYRELKAKRQEYLNKNYSGKTAKGHKTRRKQPWYMLTKGKCYNYKGKTATWGKMSKTFRVESEYSKMYKCTEIPKLTKGELTIRLLSARIKAWEMKNPMPPKDMFYWQEMKPWINRWQHKFNQVAEVLGLLSGKKMPENIKEMYESHEKQFNEEYKQHWAEENKAA